MFQPFCFYVGFVLGMCLFLFCVFVVVLFLVLFFQCMKSCFACNYGVFFELCWLKG